MGLIGIAHYLIPVLLGKKWIPMIVPLQILCIGGMTKSITTHVGTIILSKGRSDIELKWNIVNALIMPIAIVFGVNFDIFGVAVMVTVTSLILSPIIQFITNRLINLTFKEYLKSLYPAVASSFFMLSILLFIQQTDLFSHLDEFLLLSILVIVGILVYLFALWIIDKKSINEILSLMRKIIRFR
jgi:O-antigen/teichoic acid export membrane protein